MNVSMLRLTTKHRLAYCTAGPDDGLPVLFFHGWGESRLTRHPNHSILNVLGVRLITIDRPGIGLSDPQPGRVLLDWPKDISILADHLGLSQFAVLGRSAGAAYVIACVHMLPERICSATIVSGLGPPSRTALKLLAASDFGALATLHRLAPSLTRPCLWVGVRVSKPYLGLFFDRHVARLPAADREVMADPAMREMRIASLREAFRQGEEGMYEDAILFMRDWGFDLSKVKQQVRIWHGDSDTIVNFAFGQELARRLPRSISAFESGAGHYLLFGHWREILETIMADSGAKGKLAASRIGLYSREAGTAQVA
jgi:pimeloyl-ACP methyl ester carboxylesterase